MVRILRRSAPYQSWSVCICIPRVFHQRRIGRLTLFGGGIRCFGNGGTANAQLATAPDWQVTGVMLINVEKRRTAGSRWHQRHHCTDSSTVNFAGVCFQPPHQVQARQFCDSVEAGGFLFIGFLCSISNWSGCCWCVCAWRAGGNPCELSSWLSRCCNSAKAVSRSRTGTPRSERRFSPDRTSLCVARSGSATWRRGFTALCTSEISHRRSALW